MQSSNFHPKTKPMLVSFGERLRQKIMVRDIIPFIGVYDVFSAFQ